MQVYAGDSSYSVRLIGQICRRPFRLESRCDWCEWAGHSQQCFSRKTCTLVTLELYTLVLFRSRSVCFASFSHWHAWLCFITFLHPAAPTPLPLLSCSVLLAGCYHLQNLKVIRCSSFVSAAVYHKWARLSASTFLWLSSAVCTGIMLFLIVRHQSVQFTYGMMLSTLVCERKYLLCRQQRDCVLRSVCRSTSSAGELGASCLAEGRSCSAKGPSLLLLLQLININSSWCRCIKGSRCGLLSLSTLQDSYYLVRVAEFVVMWTVIIHKQAHNSQCSELCNISIPHRQLLSYAEWSTVHYDASNSCLKKEQVASAEQEEAAETSVLGCEAPAIPHFALLNVWEWFWCIYSI